MAASSKQALAFASEEQARAASHALKEPAWLLEDRLRALQRVQGLPLESSPLFTRHTEGLRGLEGLAPAAPQLTLEGPQGKGIAFAPLGKHPLDGALEQAARNDLPGFQQDQLTNLPRALFGGGAVLHLARGQKPAQPFTVHYAAKPGAAFARNLLVLEPGARATVLVEVAGGGKGLLGLTNEVLLGEGAHLELLGLDVSGPEHVTLLSNQARTGEAASLEVHHAFTGGRLAKVRSDVVLEGRGSRVRQSEVVFGMGEQRFDLTSNILHRGPETTSDALSKAALRDRARAHLKGVITLLQEGKDSDSYLQQHAMLLSKDARCIAIPSLEIVNREIKRAKHAATVAQIDEAQVFYLQTRGLSEAEARKAIVLGFLGPLLERLGEAQAERMRGLIEAKWG